jgi:hypothetical protein
MKAANISFLTHANGAMVLGLALEKPSLSSSRSSVGDSNCRRAVRPPRSKSGGADMDAKIENLDIEACRQQAENCRVLAEKVMTPAHRIMLEHIADTWLRIANDIEGHKQDAAS